MPPIIPDDRLRAASVAVESMIFFVRLSPLFASVIKNLPRLGRMKSVRFRQWSSKVCRSVSIM